MPDVPDHIKQLTNAELRKELLKVGITPAPLTPTTKKLYQKKLFLKLNEIHQTNDNEDDNFSELKKENNFQDDNFSISKDSKQPQHVSEDQISIEKTPKSEATCYYVVLTPSENQAVTSSIFDNKSDAWKLLQSNKQARFQQFSSLFKAQEFAHHETRLKIATKTKSLDHEKPNKHPAPKQVTLTSLMQAIERGDWPKYDELVWSNPRTLISSADGPVPLKPSMRYNALHIAARSNQADMTTRILSTLQNPAFHASMFNSDDKVIQNADVRMNHIIDLYLNTPEKGCFDTPLHIASKFGFTDVVAELISQPLCDKKAKNKDGDSPAQVACARASNSTERTKILFLLDEHYYLPLIRCHDNSLPPIVGQPYNPSDSTLNQNPIPQVVEPQNPIEPMKVVSALVGPMKQEEAIEVRRQWSTPNKNYQDRHVIKIRLSDLDRGEESVGRLIARESGLQWLEYWDFLGEYADLSTTEGLSRLENYLCHRAADNTCTLNPKSKLPLVENSLDNLYQKVSRLSVQSKDSKNDEKLNSLSPNSHSPIISSPVQSSCISDLHQVQLNLMKRALKCERDTAAKTKSTLGSSSPLACNDLLKSPRVLGKVNNVREEEKSENLFINGCHPTKLDRDVLFALPSSIDPVCFPYVSRWANAVLSHPEQDIMKWKTPRKKKLDQASNSSFFPASPMTPDLSFKTSFPPISLSFN